MGKLIGKCSLCGGEVKNTNGVSKCVACGAKVVLPVVETTKEGTQLLQG